MPNPVRRSLVLRSRPDADAGPDRSSTWRVLAAPAAVAATGVLLGALVAGCGSESDDLFDLPTPSGSVTVPTDLPTGLELPTGLPSGFPTELPSGFPTDLELPTDLPTGLLESLGVDVG